MNQLAFQFQELRKHERHFPLDQLHSVQRTVEKIRKQISIIQNLAPMRRGVEDIFRRERARLFSDKEPHGLRDAQEQTRVRSAIDFCMPSSYANKELRFLNELRIFATFQGHECHLTPENQRIVVRKYLEIDKKWSGYSMSGANGWVIVGADKNASETQYSDQIVSVGKKGEICKTYEFLLHVS